MTSGASPTDRPAPTVSLTAPDERGPKRSLLLAGGGVRVAYQAGVLRAFAEEGLSFHHADGTSGGTMNLAMLFSGLSPVEMCDRWRELDVLHFSSPMPLESYVKAEERMGLGDADGIVAKVFPALGIDIERVNAARGMEGTFNVCNFSRKTNEAISHRKVSLDLLVAGISLPIFMPPVEVDGTAYTDSVWIKDANLWEAVRRGAEEIWLVWCIGNTETYLPGFFNQYVHMIEISANGGVSEELDRIRDLNERIARDDSPYGQSRPIRLHVVKPEYPLPLDPDLFLGRIDVKTLIAMGYADTKRYLAQRTAEGVPLEPEATRMASPKIGVTFRETMAGSFALGESDPQAGRRKGESDGHELKVRLAIDVRDLDRFRDDPEHAGTLHGELDFTPFGERIPVWRGVFNLFSPADDLKLKLMVYEMAFEHEGQPYYLAGRKEIRDDPGFDLWQDTTTLFTRLHQGHDASAPVVGAGVLSLSVDDLVRLLTNFYATNARSAAQKAGAVRQFGSLFLGELWDTYAKHVDLD